MPWESSPPRFHLPHGQDACQWYRTHSHLQGILLQAAIELSHISGARSSYVSQPADGRGNSVPQIVQVADRAFGDFPSTHTA